MNEEQATVSEPFEAAPQVRPLIRGDKPRSASRRRSERTSPDTITRYVKWFAPLAIIGANVLLAYNSEQEGLAAQTIPFLFGTGVALLFELCRRRQLVATAMVLVLVNASIIYDAGRLLSHGDYMLGLYVSPDSVIEALSMIGLYLSSMVIGSAIFDWLLGRLFPESTVASPPLRRGLDMLFLATSTIIGFYLVLDYGAYSFYGGHTSEFFSNGVELYYVSLISCTMLVIVDETLRQLTEPSSKTWSWWTALLFAFFGVLVFMLQARRLIIMFVAFSLIRILFTPALVHWVTRSLIRPALLLGTLTAIGIAVHFGSLAWRHSAAEFETTSIVARLSDAATRLDEAGNEEDTDNLRRRIAYLATDGAAVEYRSVIGHILDLNEMFVDTVIYSVPNILFPDKFSYVPLTCEDAFILLVPEHENPQCSPQSEGYLAGGLWGVFVVSLSSAFLCGLGSMLLRRRTVLGSGSGFLLVIGLCFLEDGAFAPMTMGIRQALVVVLPVFALRTIVMFAWKGVRPNPVWRMRSSGSPANPSSAASLT